MLRIMVIALLLARITDWLSTGKPFRKQALVFMCLQYKSFENAVGK